MGGGRWTREEFARYTVNAGKGYDETTNRVKEQIYKATRLDETLNPKNVMRTCVNTEEHPNTIPVILALDVTGSMGEACRETAESLGTIMTNLYTKYTDIEFMVMGIGDLAYDAAPIQASQFESDVRIAEALDKIYMEHGGGGNAFESYTAAWYFGLYHTKLDAFDLQGRKGIIITMGDEPLNPYLQKERLKAVTGDNIQGDVATNDLYKAVCEKFDVFHIAVNDRHDSYAHYQGKIKETFGNLLKDNFKVATINGLGEAICECIDNSLKLNPVIQNTNTGEIAW